MDRIFLLQLVISFLVGGGFIAFLSFIGEKASPKIAGIILAFPSTVALSFFFISLVTSPQKIAEITPVVLVTASAPLIFATVYLYLAKIRLRKSISIFISTAGGLFVWFLIALPFAFIKFLSLPIGLGIYFLCLVVSAWLMGKLATGTHTAITIHYTTPQKIGRAIFSGSIITVSVLLAKLLNPFLGGIFSGFPAATLSTFLVLHKQHDAPFLFRLYKNFPIGTLSYIAFIIASRYTFPAWGSFFGIVSAYGVSVILFLGLWKTLNVVQRKES